MNACTAARSLPRSGLVQVYLVRHVRNGSVEPLPLCADVDNHGAIDERRWFT